MSDEIYNKVLKLQELADNQANTLADIIQDLNDLALIYENAARELSDEN